MFGITLVREKDYNSLVEYKKSEQERHKRSRLSKHEQLIKELEKENHNQGQQIKKLEEEVANYEVAAELFKEREADLSIKENKLKDAEDNIELKIEAAVATAKAEAIQQGRLDVLQVTKQVLEVGQLKLAAPENPTVNFQ